MQKINVIVEGQLLNPIPGLPPDGGTPTDPLPPSLPRTPYFRGGEVSGKPGATVSLPVYGGCSGAMSGFHIGGSSGDVPGSHHFGETVATGWELGPYLANYLKGKKAFQSFQMVIAEWRPLPVRFWEVALGFFSLEGGRSMDPIPIPPGELLFHVEFKLGNDLTPRTELEIIIKDEYFWTHSDPRKRDYLFTNDRQGYTKIETFGGKIAVTA